MLIPRPFTTAFAIAGAPIHVPPDQSREQLAEHTARVQAAMDELQETVDRWAAGGEPPDVAALRGQDVDACSAPEGRLRAA